MPPKQKVPAPIDRPLSRAYLREFTGWSTAYPPGISEPTSLRIMENVQICRDGSARIRPGLRYISYEADDLGGLAGLRLPMVGTMEPFFLNDGSKAHLFAVREVDDSVGFRVFGAGPLGTAVMSLTEAGFTFPHGEPVVRFTAGTTYVKYLQIDNKVFALSNNGETMRLFTVGTNKTVLPLASISRPDWTIEDKLTVIHPDAAWINSAAPIGLRTNMVEGPTMTDLSPWTAGSWTDLERSENFAHEGIYSAKLTSIETKRNYCRVPLSSPGTHGLKSWEKGTNTSSIAATGGGCKVNSTEAMGGKGREFRVTHPAFTGFVKGRSYEVGLDVIAKESTETTGFIRHQWISDAGAQVGDQVDKNFTLAPGRRNTGQVTCPEGATKLRIYITATASDATHASFNFKNVVIVESKYSTDFFDGGSGTNYFWTGTPEDSQSVYHPPRDVYMETYVDPITPGSLAGQARVLAGSTARTTEVSWLWWDMSAGEIPGGPTTSAPDIVGSWTAFTVVGAAPATVTNARLRVLIKSVARGEMHYVDSAIVEEGASVGGFFHGGTEDSGTQDHRWVGDAHKSRSTQAAYAAPGTLPTAETRTADTLIGSTSGSNDFSFGFFYTFNNQIGESAPSQPCVVRTQRGWSLWKWELPNAAGEPGGTSTPDPGLAADQLVAVMPEAVFDAALDQGATQWNLYMFTWSDQDPVPVVAARIATRELKPGMAYASNGWLRATPHIIESSAEINTIPQAGTRRNYSQPSRAAQGIVAADRMVLVNDPAEGAVIRWTSNQMGSYTDFTANKGGGYKTLTSGNLMIPVSVKLWQNPQSADTITILCLGTDGYSTGYYMAPSQVAQQSEAVNIMGFEETTATPGTTSPYGVEVLNNTLYHPQDEQLMKSTASNYNINHKAITDPIANMWVKLVAKDLIVSSQLDNRLYYLVNNPAGEELPLGCRGNEVWVFDTASEKGHWSRWLTPGHSLRKMEQGGQAVMSLLTPQGAFYFDDAYGMDDWVDGSQQVLTKAIVWRLETNTQGSNRAHDAWAHLQQCNVIIGNLQGRIRYGVRGLDLHGKRVDVTKVLRDYDIPGDLPYDREDFLLIRRVMKEWFFYAGSVIEEDGSVWPSYGQFDLVQYRYAPSTVNTGYEFGSVETFEYGRAGLLEGALTTQNGVPVPYVDTQRP